MRVRDYAYDKSFQPYQKEGFMLSFFLSKAVKPTLLARCGPRSIDMMTHAHTIDSCDIEELSCDIKNMEFFDRLWTSAIVNKEGEMAKTKIDTWGNIPLEDEVRKMLISRYSDFKDLFSKEEQKEFIFQIFKYVTVCGDPKKFEFDIGPYLHTARIFYKQFVSVTRDQNTGVISVESPVYKVHARMGSWQCFPRSSGSDQSYCFFIIDNRKKRLRVWHSFVP